MTGKRQWTLALLVALTLFPTASRAAHLRGRVVRVGFAARGQDYLDQGTDHYRPGHWTPVLVELTNDDGDLFDGWIEVRQSDRDGDEVVARRHATVRVTQRFFLYVPASVIQRTVGITSGVSPAGAPFAVRVFDADGKLAPLFDDAGDRVHALTPSRRLIAVQNEELVVLDISDRPVNQLAQLVTEIRLPRRLVIARSSALELPDNADGLDMADIIVWDAADPSRFGDPAQRAALLEWTRRGGKLILSVSKNWELVVKSVFGDVLPARLTGVATTTHVPELAPYLYETDNPFKEVRSLDPPLNYCPVTMNMLAGDATVVLPERPGLSDRLFVIRRPCGRGEVILATSELRELFSQGQRNERFLRYLLGLRLKSVDELPRYGRDLFQPLERVIGFQLTVQVYIIFAFLFVVAYIALVTGGSWLWLQRKGMIHYAWPAFALLAVVASGFSLGAVQVVRGIGQRVQELSVVDGKADSFDVVSTSYFGLKTASHMALDLCVPSNGLAPDEAPESRGSIRPLPANPDALGYSEYSASKPYVVISPLHELRAVPLRATAKQFEAVWRGEMGGRILAGLRRYPRRPAELSPDSWVENELDTDLAHCYLLVRSAEKYSQIVVYSLGDLKMGQRVTCGQVGAVLQEAAKQYAERLGRRGPSILRDRAQLIEPTPDDTWRLPDLSTIHIKCLEAMGVAVSREDKDQEYLPFDGSDLVGALLVLSTYDGINEQRVFSGSASEVMRSQGQRLDRSSVLSGSTALFVGFSKNSGPARLCVRSTGSKRWKAMQPETANVMYRIAIPIRMN